MSSTASDPGVTWRNPCATDPEWVEYVSISPYAADPNERVRVTWRNPCCAWPSNLMYTCGPTRWVAIERAGEERAAALVQHVTRRLTS